MKLPEQVVVGYRTYRIVDLPADEAQELDAWGFHKGITNEISVLTEGTTRADVVNTLLHEILHACYAVGNLGDSSTEETTVTVLANQLQQVLRDNPDVTRFIVQNSRR